ncbi:phosphoribosyltransferase domain-containing protein [Sphingomonas sp. PvP018]|uniref:phosphoribosyltransferase domain-containing protein n=1 Tax=Sphingomonas sp. PvP018 TaxID=2817852 RepID=UPI001D67CFDA|nr:phosphoribosyltransferase domain-containing protein [Sphingomonas sp. PvP018]MBP2513794.1 pyrimidine operon attenuation protein/uracil phosphoribosyltransferase [Sphingomonas sp. PvP018]
MNPNRSASPSSTTPVPSATTERPPGSGDFEQTAAKRIRTTDAPEMRSVQLSTGRLDVTVLGGTWLLDELCGFAARENPKRGFLVVSKVLGRHIPVAPSTMRRSASDLAARIPAGLPGPILVVGLAETAVCLGQTIHEELRTQWAREDVFFTHSTRQRIDRPLLCSFEEPHSHAAAHLIYQPELEGMHPPRSLVLVDDEISTGTTIRNLADALVATWPGIETIAVATLTDWSSGSAWHCTMPRPITTCSLLRGRLEWRPEATVGSAAAFDAVAGSLGRMQRHENFGRLGLSEAVFRRPSEPLPAITGPLRIVGTGEFTYLPFRLAEELERDGHDVVVQATSRSPAHVGGAMATKLRFEDNYGTGVPNYLYNADPTDGRTTWLAHETESGTVDGTLVGALGAHVVGWTA